MPSSLEAELKFKDLAAASNSQSDIDRKISELFWLRERRESSTILACIQELSRFFTKKKVLAHPSTMTAGSDVGRPLTTSSVEYGWIETFQRGVVRRSRLT